MSGRSPAEIAHFGNQRIVGDWRRRNNDRSGVTTGTRWRVSGAFSVNNYRPLPENNDRINAQVYSLHARRNPTAKRDTMQRLRRINFDIRSLPGGFSINC